VHIVIMGCGRVGSTLAHILEDRGHSVAVIDQDPEAFRRLGSSFKGKKITGIGFDQTVLESAGIREATAFAAVSSGDNSNVIAARVARESFGVERVAARIYDPRRAEVAFDPAWVGEKVHALEEATSARVAFITRLGEAMLPGPGIVLQEGDVLHVIAAQHDLDDLQAALGTRDGTSRRVQEKRAQDKKAQQKGAQ
jgi:trk/ktr system potassium uptake protein